MSYFDISYSYLCKNKEIMAKDLFNRYIWLVDTIYQAHGITFEEINEKWLRNATSRPHIPSTAFLQAAIQFLNTPTNPKLCSQIDIILNN